MQEDGRREKRDEQRKDGQNRRQQKQRAAHVFPRPAAAAAGKAGQPHHRVAEAVQREPLKQEPAVHDPQGEQVHETAEHVQRVKAAQPPEAAA